MWSKEFQGLDSSSQQIRRLKEILADLGMTGRLSLDRAKAIKEQRELAKELGFWVQFLDLHWNTDGLLCVAEDVREFDRATAGQSTRNRARAQPRSDSDERPGGSSSENDSAPTKRMVNGSFTKI
jgi:hypothetical protein